MSIIFYYMPMTSATPIHWALEELGVPYEKVHVNLMTGEHKKPEFLEINPNGMVPALVDGGTPMFESAAILIHLGETYGVDKGLWPAPGTPARLDALTWTVWCTATLRGPIERFMMNTHERYPAELRHAGQVEQARKDALAVLGILDERLGSRRYMLGNDFSLVDAYISAAVAFMAQIKLVDLKSLARVSDWLGRCTQRPAMAAAMG